MSTRKRTVRETYWLDVDDRGVTLGLLINLRGAHPHSAFADRILEKFHAGDELRVTVERLSRRKGRGKGE